MATWDITSVGPAWQVVYRNADTEFICGRTPKEQSSLDSVLNWLADEADAGDALLYGGTLLYWKMPSEVE